MARGWPGPGSLALVTAPADEGPVDLDAFKTQARIDATDDDAYLQALLDLATAHLDGADGILGRCLMTQSWAWRLDGWPCGGVLEVPLPPLRAVTSIAYVDTAGGTQTWDAANYQVDIYSKPGRIVPAWSATVPALRGGPQINQVTVTFSAGYGDTGADVPRPIRQAIAMLAAHWYERRVPVEIITGTMVQIPMAVDALVAPFRVHTFGRR